MENEIRTWLEDIIGAINEIESFIPSNYSFKDFQSDLKTKRAIERNLEIIGEAVSRILRVDPYFNITNARKIVDTRNRIIHGYDTVSEEIIYAIVSQDIQLLKKEIENRL